MKFETTKEIINHLECLGFIIEVEEDEEEETDVINATHISRINMQVKNNAFNNIWILCMLGITCKNTEDKAEIYKILNDINFDSWITRWSFVTNKNGDDIVCVNAGMLGYNKAKFTYLTDSIHSEIKQYFINLKKFF